ncbi:phospholipase A [Sphingobium lactosutens]|nr:phospholipase A [Sphingobium lactosutens]
MAVAAEPVPENEEPQITSVQPPFDRRPGNAFIANLAPYEPIYGVYGPGTNSEARLQISFKYRLFGVKHGEDARPSWRNGLYFAYTQRMFWDLGSDSAPFRNIDFQPELIYTTPSSMLTSGVSVAAQAGIRHESNGRDGSDSRSINSIYVMPMAALPLMGNYSLVVAPKLSIYVGDKSDNPDIVRYRGHAGLFMEVGDDEGLRLSTSARLNFGSGKGAINADLSYPLPRLLGGGPDVYLFVQSFHGYGENLLDYNRRTSRLRIGFALVR